MDCLSLPTPPSACPIFPISDRNRFVSAVTLILIDCLPATLIDSLLSVPSSRCSCWKPRASPFSRPGVSYAFWRLFQSRIRASASILVMAQ